MINGAAALAGLVRTATGTDESDVDRMLPVAAELSGLLPGRGLRRGSTVAVAGGRSAAAGGGTSLMLALLAAASRNGSWCAVVGVPALGALAAAESGIVLERLALVPNPGPDWPTVVAALIDGVDVVVTAVPGPVAAPVVSRLAARARQRGSLLVPFGEWSGADVTLRVGQGHWEGLGAGRGRLRRREVTVVAQGRGAAARPREITMWMPGISARAIVIPPAPPRPDELISPAQTHFPSGSPTIPEQEDRSLPALSAGSASESLVSPWSGRSISAVSALSDSGPAASARGDGPFPAVRGDGPVAAVRGDGPVAAVRGDGPVAAVRGDGPVAAVRGDGPVAAVRGDGPVAAGRGDGPARAVRGDGLVAAVPSWSASGSSEPPETGDRAAVVPVRALTVCPPSDGPG